MPPKPKRRGHAQSKATRAKLSKAGKGRRVSKATRAKISKANRGRKLTAAQRARLKGRKLTAAQRARISAALKGRHHPRKTPPRQRKARTRRLRPSRYVLSYTGSGAPVLAATRGHMTRLAYRFGPRTGRHTRTRRRH